MGKINHRQVPTLLYKVYLFLRQFKKFKPCFKVLFCFVKPQKIMCSDCVNNNEQYTYLKFGSIRRLKRQTIRNTKSNTKSLKQKTQEKAKYRCKVCKCPVQNTDKLEPFPDNVLGTENYNKCFQTSSVASHWRSNPRQHAT